MDSFLESDMQVYRQSSWPMSRAFDTFLSLVKRDSSQVLQQVGLLLLFTGLLVCAQTDKSVENLSASSRETFVQQWSVTHICIQQLRAIQQHECLRLHRQREHYWCQLQNRKYVHTMKQLQVNEIVLLLTQKTHHTTLPTVYYWMMCFYYRKLASVIEIRCASDGTVGIVVYKEWFCKNVTHRCAQDLAISVELVFTGNHEGTWANWDQKNEAFRCRNFMR